ncbi:hypothetical protein RHSIM_Rhsim01G0117500 [Rhododendron simsii]|uniref:F-box domain-containing protein n=1 Tax=Rhododendron simsii TaxID=118357 RepID=A0A834HKZ9_RHOSS|nr:hypothetical protein RHSIM_Rhsim01G0117500 [Rhododendron simsii]
METRRKLRQRVKGREMPDFPFDLIVDILLRLPVKPLLRFRCVSKPFCALIDSPDFVKSHLKRSTQTRNHLTLELWDYDNRVSSSVNFDSLDNAVELDHPLGSSHWPTRIVGSCHGLIGLRNREDVTLAIWNPSTRSEMHGFGYDSITDDYKMVRFVQFFEFGTDNFVSSVKVYTMKSNSWQKIRDFPYCLYYGQGCAVLVGSALHWVARRLPSDAAKFVAALDLTTEDYRVVPQPEFSDNAFEMNVAELGGCLCILCDYDQVRVDVWVMKDCGVKESWSKLFSVAQPEVIPSFESVIPVAYSKSGCEVLLVQDNTKLVWYDLEHKTIKKIKTHGRITDGFESFVCVESLVPLNGRCVPNEGGETYATD